MNNMHSLGTNLAGVADLMHIRPSDSFRKGGMNIRRNEEAEELGNIQALENYFEFNSYSIDKSTFIWLLKYALGLMAFLEMLSFALPQLFLTDAGGDGRRTEEQAKGQVDEDNLDPAINPNAILFRFFMSWLILSYAVIYAWKHKALNFRKCKALSIRSSIRESIMEGKTARRPAVTLRHLQEKSERKRKARERNASVIAWSTSFSFLLYGYILLKIRYVDLESVTEEENQHTEVFQHEKVGRFDEVQSSPETADKTALSISRWVEDFNPILKFIFSFLWFVNSFVKASSERQNRIQKREKMLLLEQYPGNDNKECTRKQAKRGVCGKQRGIEDAEDLSSAVGYSFHVYTWALFCQLSLLPVRFYILLFSFLENLMFGEKATCQVVEDELVQQCSSTGGLNHVAVNFFTKEETKYCLGYVIFLRALSLLSLKARSNVAVSVKTLKKRIVIYALRRPFQRIGKVRRTLRWIKYLTPLVLKTRKLNAGFRELLKRRRQRSIRKKAERERKRRRSSIIDPQELEDLSVIEIQAKYRAYISRRRTRALRLLAMTENGSVSFRINCRMRAWAKRAKSRMLEKEKEWHKLRLKQTNSDLSFHEKKKMYQLENQVQKGVKNKTRQRMLLRTNTKFAVAWKLFFVVGVLVEISYITLEPKVRKYKNISSNGKLGVNTVLEYYLVPELISEWPECSTDSPKRWKHIFRWISIGQEKTNKLGETVKAWYCFSPYTKIQSIYIDFVRFMIGEVLYTIGVIFFMDVFINFFTGDVCPKTGELKPRPFFMRWIIPGMAYQLYLNPWMADVRVVVNMIWMLFNYVGPARFWRWCVVLIFPCTRALAEWLKWNVYHELVAAQNKDAGFKRISL